MPQPSPEPNLHRNNAAEWAMWICLLPAFGVAWLWERVRSRRARR
jgi:hypothetical protein